MLEILTKANEILDNLLTESENRRVPYGIFAYIYAGMGNNDKAFEYLEFAFQDKEESLTQLKINPRLATLRSDPRFDDLLRRIGLPID